MYEMVFDTWVVLFCVGFLAGVLVSLFIMIIPFRKRGKKKKEKVNESKQQA